MRLHIASMVGNLISPALASVLMTHTGPWVLMFCALCISVAFAGGMLLVPEMIPNKEEAEDAAPNHESLKLRLLQGLCQFKLTIGALTRPSILLLLTDFLSLPIIMCTLQFLSQFVSKRYHIPIAQTGYIQSVYGIAHVAVVLLVVPFIGAMIVNPWMPALLRVNSIKHRDLQLARWLYVAAMVGTFILGASPSLPGFITGLLMMALGSGAGSFVKSIANVLVDAKHRSGFFSLMGISMIISDTWATPMLAGLFSLGMRLGGGWIGLPYFGVSVISLLSVCIMLLIRIPAQAYENRSFG